MDRSLRPDCWTLRKNDLPPPERVVDSASGKQAVENPAQGLRFDPECHLPGDIQQGLVVEKRVFSLLFDACHRLFEGDVPHVERNSAVLGAGSRTEQHSPAQQGETDEHVAQGCEMRSVPEVGLLICFHG